MLTTFLIASLLTEPGCSVQDTWLSEPSSRSGPRARREARQRARRACRAMGATREACEVADVIAVRESSGDPCAVHVLAAGEYGIGLHGLSWKYYASKWFGPLDADVSTETFRVPEVSAVVTIRVLRRAVARYKASTWRDVGAVFGGCIYGNRACTNWKREEGWCRRLAARGIACEGDPRGQLGTKLGMGPTKGQRAFILRLQRGP